MSILKWTVLKRDKFEKENMKKGQFWKEKCEKDKTVKGEIRK